MASMAMLDNFVLPLDDGYKIHMLHVWYFCLQNWVIFFGQMLVYKYSIDGAYGIYIYIHNTKYCIHTVTPFKYVEGGPDRKATKVV